LGNCDWRIVAGGFRLISRPAAVAGKQQTMETAGPGAGGGGGGGPTRHKRRCGRRLDAACVVQSAGLPPCANLGQSVSGQTRWPSGPSYTYVILFGPRGGMAQFYRYTALPVAPTAVYLPSRHRPLPLSLPLASRSPSPSQSRTRAAPGRRAVGGAAACAATAASLIPGRTPLLAPGLALPLSHSIAHACCPGPASCWRPHCLCSHRRFPHPRPHGAVTSLGSHLDVSSVLLLPKFALRLCLRCWRDEF
jgi:hypothetical protein